MLKCNSITFKFCKVNESFFKLMEDLNVEKWIANCRGGSIWKV